MWEVEGCTQGMWEVEGCTQGMWEWEGEGCREVQHHPLRITHVYVPITSSLESKLDSEVQL